MSGGHTPGPWNVCGMGNVWADCKVADTRYPAQSPVYRDPSPQEREANARLIAAAPDLLAALQAIDLARHTDAPADWTRATELSDAAIDKATRP